jgi:hypothetical protein
VKTGVVATYPAWLLFLALPLVVAYYMIAVLVVILLWMFSLSCECIAIYKERKWKQANRP